MELNEIIGYLFGGAALIAVFITYQIHDKKRLLIMQTCTIVLMCMHYLFLGADSGFALNVVCIARNVVFFFRDKNKLIGNVAPVFFAAVLLLVSVFSWEGYYSIFMLAGLVINTLCIGYFDPQKLRYSLLLTCTIVIIYDLSANSYPGVVFESIGIISAIVGIVRYNKEKRISAAK